MNHTQKELHKLVKQIRQQEQEYLSWGGPDPRGERERSIKLELADQMEQVALIENKSPLVKIYLIHLKAMKNNKDGTIYGRWLNDLIDLLEN